MAGDEELQREVDGPIGRIWLNRPEKRNAITDTMRAGIDDALTAFEEDPAVRMIVIRGRGGTFCSGADLGKSVAGRLGQGSSFERVARGARMLTRLSNLGKPSLAVVEGYATAGGFELMLACDFAIAVDTAKIGDFHIRRALVAGAGPFYRLPRIVGMRRARELMLSGKLLGAQRALDWGLLNEVAPADELDATVDEFVADFVDKSPFALRLTKLVLNRSLDADTETLMALESLAVGAAFNSEDAREGVAAFLEKREPQWTGA
jgi:enoyl-CoA hydratase/carnithine racemase